MKHYREGTRVFIFGFSRGAYTARFLNEMLDYIGLLGPDNEEVLPVVWETFAGWKLSKVDNMANRMKMANAYSIMKSCRETLSRPMPRVHFLGMFDAVNSVADFEVNIDRLPCSRIIRHAVSIDERRTKFRPVLLGLQFSNGLKRIVPHQGNRRSADVSLKSQVSKDGEIVKEDIPQIDTSNAVSLDVPGKSTGNAPRNSQDGRSDNDDDELQDAEEIWFPGGHADVGGGFHPGDGERWQLSHSPLVWMVQEARRAGLRFDKAKLKHLECIGDYDSDETRSPEMSSARKSFLDALHEGATKGMLHDLLHYGHGLPVTSVLSWRLLEHLPVRRIDLRPDGSWEDVRWPPPRGEHRSLPRDAKVHVSAIQRMKCDSSYRPVNLTRGWSKEADRAITATGVGPWVVHEHEGDPVRETYIVDQDKLQQLEYLNNNPNGL